ncbi:hypothetical protein BJ875DRAFT_506952 [Amylocarpus encephaloides]|uniref:CID domain-containing protein n=1 Tax=Amylocarpus encephaloides TaxID=45428 RepID=A0A9P7YC56_9HELO|nr:hypothetical protein BJ875DRAFT_506952 [Amylocarpus encephaloides]
MNSEVADGVAEDFRSALVDLTLNSRYEISNLTVIARENTEHAYAISESLKSHIKQTSPQKKLPAFYVLDSVVKNVGTPYTIFLSRGLYTTFMEAYALVDVNVRRKMDEMLKTWKEPVPGALDSRPVFPRDVTSPIENALIKARTSALQAHNEYLQSQRQQQPRPHLISRLYEKLGMACTQCGRRFEFDEVGKKKKADHMDWHFKVHQRMREAEKNGQHRSLYVDELDWIKSREVEGDEVATAAAGVNGKGVASSSVDSKPELLYLPVPDDPDLASSHCPICKEKFETKWLYNADEFVWMDAKKIGDRIFHASCYAEATKDLSSLLKRNTPEPVLGKRKAEDDQQAMRAKIKTEPIY